MNSKTVLCHGVFDVTHVGHLDHLLEAKSYGDRLVVSVTSDRYVNKGPLRPHFKQDDRVRMIKELKCVDEVILNDNPTAVPVILSVKPTFYVKGPDYSDVVDGRLLQEKEALAKVGGELVFTRAEKHSSSELINSYFDVWNEAQEKCIKEVKLDGGLDAIEETLDRLETTSVVIVGELIRDHYVFVEPQGVSSKSPSLSVNVINEETYEGGVSAVHSIVETFVKDAKLIHNNAWKAKTRYIWPSKNQTIFEVTKDGFGTPRTQEEVCKSLEFDSKLPTIVCDFGHGMFEGRVLGAIKQRHDKAPLALNVQANSSNFGFNRYDKHLGFSYLCIDTREARLAFGDRHLAGNEAVRKLSLRNLGSSTSVTLGSDGAVFSPWGGNVYSAPTFSGKFVDAIGAGDAYFAITALLNFVDAKPQFIPFIGNVLAGIKVGIMGHRTTPTKQQLLKALTAILK